MSGSAVALAGNGESSLADEWWLSDGEVHFLWWFIQGSIMVPETRWRLWWGWGFCPRHAWGALRCEAAYRHGYLHGPVMLYEDLIGRALQAVDAHGPWRARRVAWRLRDRGPCLMCALDFTAATRGLARVERIEQGRDASALRELARRTRPHWEPAVCGACAGRATTARCRAHFREDVGAGRPGRVDELRARLAGLLAHLVVYSHSFMWGHRGTESDEDRAALIGAVGWCSGWRGLLALMEP